MAIVSDRQKHVAAWSETDDSRQRRSYSASSSGGNTCVSNLRGRMARSSASGFETARSFITTSVVTARTTFSSPDEMDTSSSEETTSPFQKEGDDVSDTFCTEVPGAQVHPFDLRDTSASIDQALYPPQTDDWNDDRSRSRGREITIDSPIDQSRSCVENAHAIVEDDDETRTLDVAECIAVDASLNSKVQHLERLQSRSTDAILAEPITPFYAQDEQAGNTIGPVHGGGPSVPYVEEALAHRHLAISEQHSKNSLCLEDVALGSDDEPTNNTEALHHALSQNVRQRALAALAEASPLADWVPVPEQPSVSDSGGSQGNMIATPFEIIQKDTSTEKERQEMKISPELVFMENDRIDSIDMFQPAEAVESLPAIEESMQEGKPSYPITQISHVFDQAELSTEDLGYHPDHTEKHCQSPPISGPCVEDNSGIGGIGPDTSPVVGEDAIYKQDPILKSPLASMIRGIQRGNHDEIKKDDLLRSDEAPAAGSLEEDISRRCGEQEQVVLRCLAVPILDEDWRNTSYDLRESQQTENLTNHPAYLKESSEDLSSGPTIQQDEHRADDDGNLVLAEGIRIDETQKEEEPYDEGTVQSCIGCPFENTQYLSINEGEESVAQSPGALEKQSDTLEQSTSLDVLKAEDSFCSMAHDPNSGEGGEPAPAVDSYAECGAVALVDGPRCEPSSSQRSTVSSENEECKAGEGSYGDMTGLMGADIKRPASGDEAMTNTDLVIDTSANAARDQSASADPHEPVQNLNHELVASSVSIVAPPRTEETSRDDSTGGSEGIGEDDLDRVLYDNGDDDDDGIRDTENEDNDGDVPKAHKITGSKQTISYSSSLPRDAELLLIGQEERVHRGETPGSISLDQTRERDSENSKRSIPPDLETFSDGLLDTIEEALPLQGSVQLDHCAFVDVLSPEGNSRETSPLHHQQLRNAYSDGSMRSHGDPGISISYRLSDPSEARSISAKVPICEKCKCLMDESDSDSENLSFSILQGNAVVHEMHALLLDAAQRAEEASLRAEDSEAKVQRMQKEVDRLRSELGRVKVDLENATSDPLLYGENLSENATTGGVSRELAATKKELLAEKSKNKALTERLRRMQEQVSNFDRMAHSRGPTDRSVGGDWRRSQDRPTMPRNQRHVRTVGASSSPHRFAVSSAQSREPYASPRQLDRSCQGALEPETDVTMSFTPLFAGTLMLPAKQ